MILGLSKWVIDGVRNVYVVCSFIIVLLRLCSCFFFVGM